MLAQTYFSRLARRVQQLLGCETVLLALHCPDAELCHPLLQWLPGNRHVQLYGAVELFALFEHEQVRALRDLACQLGRARYSNAIRVDEKGVLIEQVTIAPLVYPAGIAGYFVLSGAFAGGFTPGDMRLLESYLPTVLTAFENNVRSLCSAEQSLDGASGIRLPEQNIFPQANDHDTNGLANTLKHDLIAIASHELRAPLTAIKGYAALLQAYGQEERQSAYETVTAMTPDRQQQYLDIILDQTSHLELLMNDLLDASRIQAGKLALRYTEVDIASLCQQAMRLATQRIDQSDRDRYTLRCEVSSHLPPIRSDAHRLQQILSNLLDNAIKYSPGGGKITLRANVKHEHMNNSSDGLPQAARRMLHISIQDHGIGINAQQRALLFQPFSRLDSPLTVQVPGAGLGLYITHRLVEAMQGTIELTSQENTGTSITLRFPIQEPVEAPQSKPVLSL